MYLNARILSLKGKGIANAKLTEEFLFPSPYFKGWRLKDISWERQVDNQLM